MTNLKDLLKKTSWRYLIICALVFIVLLFIAKGDLPSTFGKMEIVLEAIGLLATCFVGFLKWRCT